MKLGIKSILLAKLAALAALSGMASTAAAQDVAKAPPKAFADAVACRDMVDDGARLSCYDAAIGALAEAQANEEIVVITGEEVRDTRRGLFGLKLPKLFAGDDGKEEFTQIEATIAEVRQGRSGYTFVLEDGAVWTKTDDKFLRKPQAGQTILIKKAAMGSFWGRVEDGATFRIKRVD